MTRPSSAGPKGIAKAATQGAESAGGDVVGLGGTKRHAPGQAPDNNPPDADSIRRSAKKALIDMLHAAASGDDMKSEIRDAAAKLVRAANGGGTDVAALAHGIVEGAVDAGSRLGLDPRDAAEAAAVGALAAAGDFGEGATEQLKTSLSGAIAGVRPLDRSIFPPGRRAP